MVAPDLARLDAWVYNAAGTRQGAGPIFNIRGLERTFGINRIGSWQFTMPASDRRAAFLAQGYELRFHREGDGEIFRGILEGREWQVQPGRGGVPVVTGASPAIELLWDNTYDSIVADADTVATVMTALLTSGWTRTATGTYTNTVSHPFKNETLFSAYLRLANIANAYVRENATVRDVEIKNTSADSGIVLMNADAIHPAINDNTKLGLISGIRRAREDGTGIFNRVVPFGKTDGGLYFDLGLSNRASPYTITSRPGPRPAIENWATSDEEVNISTATRIIEVAVDAKGTSRLLLAFLESSNIRRAVIRGATANGQEMTQLFEVSGASTQLNVFYLIAPRQGTINGVATVVSAHLTLTVIALKNCDQIAPIRDSGSDFETSRAAALEVAGVTSDDDDLALDFGTGSSWRRGWTPDAGQTEQFDQATTPGGPDRIFASTKAGSDSGVTMGWDRDYDTLGRGGEAIMAVMSIKPELTY